MVNRLGVFKKAIYMGLTVGGVVASMLSCMLSGAAFGGESQAQTTDTEQTVSVENQAIVFSKVGPNEQVIYMDTLRGYANLHNNIRRRNISLSDRYYTSKPQSPLLTDNDSQVTAVDSETSK